MWLQDKSGDKSSDGGALTVSIRKRWSKLRDRFVLHHPAFFSRRSQPQPVPCTLHPSRGVWGLLRLSVLTTRLRIRTALPHVPVSIATAPAASPVTHHHVSTRDLHTRSDAAGVAAAVCHGASPHPTDVV